MTPDAPDLPGAILTVNTGSSSVKLALYAGEDDLTLLARISVERIGAPESRLSLTSRAGRLDESIVAHGHASAVMTALDRALSTLAFTVRAVGHRIVHGGSNHAAPEKITAALLAELRQLGAIDPTHMPQALAAVDSLGGRYSAAPQFACFDTAFHRSMPSIAQRYPLPRWADEAGVRRYGFHGLSCEFIVKALERIDPSALAGRLLIAHLGNGASVTAVRGGASVDTTMGVSPTGGLMMGTRSGDLDPTVLTLLGRSRRLGPDEIQRLVDRESGLLGVSGISADMRDLLGTRDSPHAAEAVELFAYLARKQIGALAAVLDGLDTIVFTGGIGEHAAPVREKICGGLGYLGVRLNPDRNAANDAVISASDSRVMVRVIQTDEDLVIANHVRDLLARRDLPA